MLDHTRCDGSRQTDKHKNLLEMLQRDGRAAVASGGLDGLLGNDVELRLSQVVAGHQHQRLAEIALRDDAVVVHVVDAECHAQSLLHRGLRVEGRQRRDELLEVHLVGLFGVEQRDDAHHEWIHYELVWWSI